MSNLRQLFAGVALAALAASSSVFAQPTQEEWIRDCTERTKPEHPLLNSCTAATKYSAGLGRAFTAGAGDKAASLFAGAFVGELERSYLKQPADQTRVLVFPNPSYRNIFGAKAVIPPQGMAREDIPVCLEKDGKILGTYAIKTTGDIVPMEWSGPREAASDTGSACKSFIFAAREAINQKVAQQPVPPLPAQALKTSALMQ